MPIRILCTVALLLAALATGMARAAGDFYLTLGLGQATLHQLRHNGHWYQDGYGYVLDEKANAWKIGAGWQVSRRLALEADWRDLGEYNGIARFVNDDNYNVDQQTCREPCDPTLTGWQNGTARGLGLSAVFSQPGRITPFIRAGAFVHQVKFRSYVALADSPLDRRIHTTTDDNFDRIGVRAFGGIGVRYKNLDIEYTFYPDVGTVLTAYRHVSTLMISARF